MAIANADKTIQRRDLCLCQVAAENVRPSEMLPDGWNDSDGLYTLLYQTTDSHETFLLKIVCNGDDLLTHLVVSFTTKHLFIGQAQW